MKWEEFTTSEKTVSVKPKVTDSSGPIINKIDLDQYGSPSAMFCFWVLAMFNTAVFLTSLKIPSGIADLGGVVIGTIGSLWIFKNGRLYRKNATNNEPFPYKVINIVLLIILIIAASSMSSSNNTSSDILYASDRDKAVLNRIRSNGFDKRESEIIFKGAKALCAATDGEDC